jgi:fructose-1,6-bisphosphatase/inositol monophosphatase family enzyme
LIEVGIHVVRYVIKQVLTDVADDPESALEYVHIGDQKKPALRVDINAEDSFKRELHKFRNRRFKNVKFYGEESLRKKTLNLTAGKELVALADAIDGTELLERGLSNWCCAVAFFNPRNEPGQRLMASFAGLPSGEVYYATSESDGALLRANSVPTDIAGPSKVKSLKKASVCFYGQKTENFLSVAQASFAKNLLSLNQLTKKRRAKLNLRIYNLGGIPMMLKLADHRVRHARGIDAVFDVEGQKPHDFVPGAFIAKKSGAIVKHLNGRDISYEDMEELLLRPASTEIKYMIAATESLSKELLALLTGGTVGLVRK